MWMILGQKAVACLLEHKKRVSKLTGNRSTGFNKYPSPHLPKNSTGRRSILCVFVGPSVYASSFFLCLLEAGLKRIQHMAPKRKIGKVGLCQRPELIYTWPKCLFNLVLIKDYQKLQQKEILARAELNHWPRGMIWCWTLISTRSINQAIKRTHINPPKLWGMTTSKGGQIPTSILDLDADVQAICLKEHYLRYNIRGGRVPFMDKDMLLPDRKLGLDRDSMV